MHAIILASVRLSGDVPSKEGKPIAAGEAYFISDGNDIGFFIYFKILFSFEI